MKHILLAACLAIGSTTFAQLPSIKPEEAARHVGDSLKVCGTVDAGKYLATGTSHLTLLDMGGRYPNNAFTVVIPPTLRDSLAVQPEVVYKAKEMCFTGRIVLFKEKPQMVLQQRTQVAPMQ